MPLEIRLFNFDNTIDNTNNTIDNTNNTIDNTNNIIDDKDISDFNKKRLDFYKELNKFFLKNPELLEKIISKYNSIENRKKKEKPIYINILSKKIDDINDYNKIKENLKGETKAAEGKGKGETAVEGEAEETKAAEGGEAEEGAKEGTRGEGGKAEGKAAGEETKAAEGKEEAAAEGKGKGEGEEGGEEEAAAAAEGEGEETKAAEGKGKGKGEEGGETAAADKAAEGEGGETKAAEGGETKAAEGEGGEAEGKGEGEEGGEGGEEEAAAAVATEAEEGAKEGARGGGEHKGSRGGRNIHSSKSNFIRGGSYEDYYNNDKNFYKDINLSEQHMKDIKKIYKLNIELNENKNFKENDNPMQKFINEYYKANNEYDKNVESNPYQTKQAEEKLKTKLIDAVDEFDNNPMNPLDILSIKNDDRIVFIAITFIIRYVTLLLVNWCVEIDIIKSFNDAFILFTFIYIIIFWLIVMIINVTISPELSGESSIIGKVQSVLYYFHFRINDIGRLLVHTLLILLLLLIPIIVKSENKINDDPLTYDERMKLYNTLSLFTIFMWLFTSIIATKY